ncbi:DUF6011 domain-containing protein [Streptomyces sp. NBRC 109706]|uniref:DUF6011 domain-containing protein n=1 Tax=Streptomyces sp. NBRC 109706 TaxID=1550035 RepID=UPI000782F95E|nr:DUF6011 domain-containing protein [Streptomyces sp. NBRC 109706]
MAPNTEDDQPALLPDPEERRRPPVHCRLCGRPLRDREARTWGLGPECRAKLALRTAPPPPERPVDQDPLPGL